MHAPDPRFLNLLATLHRGGAYGYYWRLSTKQSTWWNGGGPPALPTDHDLYFGVHACRAIPPTNAHGETRQPPYVKAQNAYIAAINGLFAEVDAKDFPSKQAALAHVDRFDPQPSDVIDSGGGYHCYWRLSAPLVIDDEAQRERAQSIQAGWVRYVGGDEGAKDLARVLRVPGTLNTKYNPPRPVEWVRSDPSIVYDLDELVALCKPEAPTPAAQPPEPVTIGASSDAVKEWANRKLNTAITKIVTAAEGAKHRELLNASRLAGGLSAHFSQQQIESALEAALRAQPNVKDWRGAMKTIRDGMGYGESAPLVPPKEPSPLLWKANHPYCPECGNEARPSKFHADGLYCDCQRPAIVWRGLAAMPPEGQALPADWAVKASDDRPIYVSGPTAPHGITTLIDVPPPSVVWFAPGFIREGLGLIVGQPNVGKTPLAVQMALAAAAGVPWLGAVAMEPVKVLYLGCEYSKQELYPLIMESAAAMGLKFGRDITDDNFCYKTQDDLLPDSPDAAIADLEFYVALGFKLIIIDTLTAFLPPEKFKQNVYRGDYKELQPYHRLALRHSIALIGVWHASKREADPKLMYNGSTGMWAVPSSRIAMYEDTEGRKRISSFPRLGDRTDWALTQEKTMRGRRWVVADAAPEPEMSPSQQIVYRWLRENSDKANPRSPSTVAEMTGQPIPTVKTSLTRLFERNLIQSAGRGAYYVGKIETFETSEAVETLETFETTSEKEAVSKFQHYSRFETFDTASESAEVAKFQKFQGFDGFKVSSEQIAILGAILSRRTPQSEAHAVSLCEQWGVDLEAVRSKVLQLYHGTEEGGNVDM